ncbi:hypothetical protein B0H13DRAFT_2329434 [Mycena leptocephala]|nr:hypothetical protein B0H13DRAFT_2329434 [Mycena leptocephala]
MESALLGVDDLAGSSRFAKLPEWKYFVVVSEERISILKGLNAGKWASFKACDDIRCVKIRDSRRCSRCSGCRSAYYRSSDCQVIDWQDGGHRDLGAGVGLVLVPLRKSDEQLDPSRLLDNPASTAEYDVYPPTEIH